MLVINKTFVFIIADLSNNDLQVNAILLPFPLKMHSDSLEAFASLHLFSCVLRSAAGISWILNVTSLTLALSPGHSQLMKFYPACRYD